MTVKEFWESKEELCIHCDTKEKANKLLKKFHELGKKWNDGMSYLKDSNYFYFQERTVYLNNGLLSFLSNAKRQNIEIIEFDDLEDFKENHEKDVFNYQFLDEYFIPIPKTYTPKDMLIVNKEKKYVLLKFSGKEYRVDCHKEDKFDWLIGFGLALSKFYGNWNKSKNAREYFRNPKTHKLNYKEYAKWCVFDFFINDTTKISNLQNKVKEINEYGKVDL